MKKRFFPLLAILLIPPLLAACGARVEDARALDSVMEKDVVTNFHVAQILTLRHELLETLSGH